MASPKVPDHVLQEAVDLVAKHGSPHFASLATGIPSSTLGCRCNMAAHRGIVAGAATVPVTPQAAAAAPARRPATRPTREVGRSHLIIPDVQAKPGTPNDHMEWIANYALEHRPDLVLQIGDWGDMPSLSSYDKGKRGYEGRRYVDDVDATRASVERFERPIEDHNRTHVDDPYDPEKKITGGNHEQRIVRATDIDPMLYGKLDISDLGFEDYGWTYHPFLEIVEVDGVQYSHYFTGGAMGRPVSTARALLWEAGGRSATMGHVQHTDIHLHKKTLQTGLFCGICYLHDENYLGAQGNSTRRGIVMKREVKDGVYDLEFVSLEQLRKRYS